MTSQPDPQSTCPKTEFAKHAHHYAPQHLVGTVGTPPMVDSGHTPAPTVNSEGSRLLRAAHTRAPQTPVQQIHPVQLERAVADAVENDNYTGLVHLQ